MNPYQLLPQQSFWRSAIAERNALSISDLWTPKFNFDHKDPIVTAGSCFAQQLGRALVERRMNWIDAEPAPEALSPDERKALNYGIFSFRTGNIYTPALLRQWLEWAFGRSAPPDEVWNNDGRFFDPFRPAIEPNGFVSAEALYQSRLVTLAAIERAITAAKFFVFTLGLTEAWENHATSTVYPICPGTIRGTFDAGIHRFRNFTFSDTHKELSAAIELMRGANPRLRIILMVSPVPLTATATGQHALTAMTYTKSVLRAVAGQMCDEYDQVDYFPSYELITGFPFKGAFFEKNMRSVSPHGVEFVMRHFFNAIYPQGTSSEAARGEARAVFTEDSVCEDAVLDYYAER